jgi:hypothetical protein
MLRLENSFNLLYDSLLFVKPCDIRFDSKLFLFPRLLVNYLHKVFYISFKKEERKKSWELS